MKNYGSEYDEIATRTGFDSGERFANDDEVRAYFTAEAQIEMFGDDAVTDAATLEDWADAVIENRWWMTE